MSISETIFLFILALVFFGPKKLPEIARTIGKYMNEFKRASNEFKAQIEQEISNLEVTKQPTILPPSQAPTGAASRTLTVGKGPGSDDPSPSAPLQESTMGETAADEPLFATAGATAVSSVSEASKQPHETSPAASQESHV
jgi:sec-independent protein translocase protein TatB